MSSKQLYSLEVYVHTVQELKNVATTANPCIAFRLWNFPTLYVQPDLMSRGTEVVSGSYRSLAFESGQSCLFAVHPDELVPHLPLTLHVLLVDERSAAERRVLASQALVVGDREVTAGPGGVQGALRCTIKRGVFPLLDVYHDKIGTMTVDVRLTCLGNTALPHLLNPAAGGTVGAPDYRADRDRGPFRRRDDLESVAGHVSYEDDDPPQRRRKPRRHVVVSAPHPQPSPPPAVSGALVRVADVAAPPPPPPPVRQQPYYPYHPAGGHMDVYRPPVQSEEQLPPVAGDFSVAKFLRYEVMAQLSTLYSLLEEYVTSERDLGKVSQYGEDERGFFSKQLAVMKDVSHSTTRVLQAVDQFCGSNAFTVVRSRDAPRALATAPPQGGGGARPIAAGPSPSPSPSVSFDVGDRVRMRDVTTEAWLTGTVASVGAGGLPSIRADGMTKTFQWNLVEPMAKAPPTAKPDFAFEERVAVSMPGGGLQAGLVDSVGRDGTVAVVLDGQKLSKSFPAASVQKLGGKVERSASERERELEKEKYLERGKDDDKDRLREKERELEREKEREEKDRQADREKDKLRDMEREKERLREAELEKEREAKSGGRDGRGADDKSKAQELQVGDRVRMRDRPEESWRTGVVTDIDKTDGIFVRPDRGSKSFTWNYVERAAAAEPAKGGSTTAKFKVGAKVRVRDTESESWRHGEVTEMVGDTPKVRVNGQVRSFTWRMVEAEEGEAPKPAPSFSVGDRVRVRDSERENWRHGEVTRADGDKPQVKVDGQSRAFTWQFVEAVAAAKFKEGDRVRMRDSSATSWQEGKVTGTDAQGRPLVCADGHTRSFTYLHVEAVQAAADGSAKVRVGDRVRVRDTSGEQWREGVVTDVRSDGKPLVRVDGSSRDFHWGQVELVSDKDRGSSAGGSTSTKFAVGDRVRMRDREAESWRTGTVTEASGSQTRVREDGGSRGLLWQYIERLPQESSIRFRKGDRVRVRDAERAAWKEGEVVDFSGDRPKVLVDGASNAFTWAMVEHLSPFKVGDKVQVRDTERGAWRRGEVTGLSSGKPLVRVDGTSQSLHFVHVEAVKDEARSSDAIKVGDKVQMRDTERVPWQRGEVIGFSGTKPLVKAEGSEKAYSWTFVERVAKFKVGDKVRVRDSERDPWKRGTVSDFRGAVPIVREQGATTGYTWAYVEPAAEERFAVGDRVRVRDSAREDWKAGEVTSHTAGGQPVVRAEGTSRSFTWAMVERLPGGGKEEKKDSRPFKKGDRVRVRDSEREDWRKGEVTEEGARPKVRVDGQSRPFTWGMVEHLTAEPSKPEMKIGDKVRMRDSDKDPWKRGEITDFSGGKPLVKGEGTTRSFKWNYVELEKQGGKEVKWAKGDKVRVRDIEAEQWREGEVTEVDAGGRPRVRCNGASRAFTWAFVERSGAAAPASATTDFKTGDRVRVRDSESQQWANGTVTGYSGSNYLVRADGSTRAFQWTFVEKPAELKTGDRVRARDGERDEWKRGTVQGFASGGNPLVLIDGGKRPLVWKFVEGM
eukprot:TRINITY_DN3475_c1_g2_i1.p1 TRINITY_DN3475_c1_g2~~TRINITY_DN3475_c1_g2_i1.p1  ORF type:complete len:1546 (+),score=597.31 TRINITY_DN3475_c1_g2_i1:79-4638(+)